MYIDYFQSIILVNFIKFKFNIKYLCNWVTLHRIYWIIWIYLLNHIHYKNKIDFLALDDNLEIEYFGEKVFYSAHITKFKISAKVQKLNSGWCAKVFDLTEIESFAKQPQFYILQQWISFGQKWNE